MTVKELAETLAVLTKGGYGDFEVRAKDLFFAPTAYADEEATAGRDCFQLNKIWTYNEEKMLFLCGEIE